ncbi:hypothetical protein [Actinomadura sp. DC4]|uniref:hypothetical protein n=1 Tax=Actinomadura sp. DC4 TaxID=3055069 RepID=UPI0025B2064C|nr:hypothetical protein [Actinomadura sp. DC4]MDN3356518.1 hypothetical protein [Actinomadura sp. DC4]
MTSFSGAAAGMAVVVLAGVAAPAQAVARRRLVPVPCGAASLAAAVAATPSVLRLAPLCTYLIASALPQVTGDIALVGGPATTLKRDPSAADLRLLDVAAGGRLRVLGITLRNGGTTTGPGGVRNAGTLVLDHVTLTGNTALNDNGGGPENTGNALIAHSVFAANATRGRTATETAAPFTMTVH